MFLTFQKLIMIPLHEIAIEEMGWGGMVALDLNYTKSGFTKDFTITSSQPLSNCPLTFDQDHLLFLFS
jgi:hypothetical protein